MADRAPKSWLGTEQANQASRPPAAVRSSTGVSVGFMASHSIAHGPRRVNTAVTISLGCRNQVKRSSTTPSPFSSSIRSASRRPAQSHTGLTHARMHDWRHRRLRCRSRIPATDTRVTHAGRVCVEISDQRIHALPQLRRAQAFQPRNDLLHFAGFQFDADLPASPSAVRGRFDLGTFQPPPGLHHFQDRLVLESVLVSGSSCYWTILRRSCGAHYDDRLFQCNSPP